MGERSVLSFQPEVVPDPKPNKFREWPPAGKFTIGIVSVDYDHTGFTIGVKGKMVREGERRETPLLLFFSFRVLLAASR